MGGGSTSGGRAGLKKTKVEIIPMIDTMFFLLVFFILSSVGVVKLQGINVNLPQESSLPTQALEGKEITVAVNADRNITVNAQPVGPSGDIRPLLRREMNKIYGVAPDMTKVSVTISAERSVPHGIVVRCIDQARALNVVNFAIAGRTDAERGAVPELQAPTTVAPAGQ